MEEGLTSARRSIKSCVNCLGLIPLSRWNSSSHNLAPYDHHVEDSEVSDLDFPGMIAWYSPILFWWRVHDRETADGGGLVPTKDAGLISTAEAASEEVFVGEVRAIRIDVTAAPKALDGVVFCALVRRCESRVLHPHSVGYKPTVYEFLYYFTILL